MEVCVRALIGRALRATLAAALQLVWAAAWANEPQWTIEGYVVYIGTGDTLTILDKQRREHRVRIDGIGHRRRHNLSARHRSAASTT